MAESDSSYDLAPQEPSPERERVEARKPAPVVPDEPLVERSCPHCGFKIIGKPKRNRCPDCNAPLDSSVTDLLQFSNSGWVRGIAWGPMLAAVGVLAQVGAVVVMWLVSYAQGLLGQAIGAALVCAGVWMVTGRETGGPPPRRPAAGVAARWLGLLAVALWAVTWLVAMPKADPAHHAGVRLLTAAALAAAALTFGALGLFLNALTARVPHDGLAAQFHNFTWLLPAVLAVPLIHQFFDLTPFFQWIFFCTFPLTGALVGICLWAAIALLRLGLELRAAAATADDLVYKREQRAKKEQEKRGGGK